MARDVQTPFIVRVSDNEEREMEEKEHEYVEGEQRKNENGKERHKTAKIYTVRNPRV